MTHQWEHAEQREQPTNPAANENDRPRPRFAPNRTVVFRDVEPHEVAERLRGMLGLDPESPAPGELAASFERPMPPLVEQLDAGGWVAWCLAGLPLFGGGFPQLADVRREAKRAVIVLALLREGSLLGAERLTGTSRKVLRENLRRFGLHPWPRVLRHALGALSIHAARSEL